MASPKVTRYRETTKAIRETAAKAHDPAVQDELLALAVRYERMADRADQQGQ